MPVGENNKWFRFAGLTNSIVQGTCADGLKLAMVDIWNQLPKGASIVSTVHDELIVETPTSAAEESMRLIVHHMRESMQTFLPGVPIDIEAKICMTWGDKGTSIECDQRHEGELST